MEQHLTLEALARLVDEAPSPEERAHLAACPECVERLDALREQTESLGRLPDVRPPRGDWAALEARMASEGLIRPEPNLFTRVASTPSWMRAAAAAVLFVAGVGVGSTTAGPAAPAPGGSPASGGPSVAASTGANASSVEEAADYVRLKEREYRDALVQYAQMAGGDAVAVNPEARLASLDYSIVSLQAGLQAAPADPVLNGFLTSMMAERENTLRQISTTTEYF